MNKETKDFIIEIFTAFCITFSVLSIFFALIFWVVSTAGSPDWWDTYNCKKLEVKNHKECLEFIYPALTYEHSHKVENKIVSHKHLVIPQKSK